MQEFNNARNIAHMTSMPPTIPYAAQLVTSREARKIRKTLTGAGNWARTYLAAHEISSRIDCETVEGTIQYTLHLTVKMLREDYSKAMDMERIMSGHVDPTFYPKDDLLQALPVK
jgi:hypothetical protein